MRLVLAAALALAVTPAFADALTYKGALDDRDIILEIIEPSDGPVGGRFAYLDKGGDIPLDPAASPEGMYYFAEQAPCSETNCVPDDNGTVDMPPRAATWALTVSDDGRVLEGTRTSESKKAGVQRIELHLIGRRPLGSAEPTPFGLHDYSAMLGFDLSMPFTKESAPYEYALMDIEYQVDNLGQSADGSEYFYATDPRTKFAFPRVGILSDGSDTAIINDKLAEQQSRMSLSALDCLAFRYAAWGQSNNFFGQGGNLGDYDYETVTLDYLSPRLVSWVQAGSLYCVAAHPYNHYDVYNYDVRTGQRVDERAILAAWVPREYGSLEEADTDLAFKNPDAYQWGPSAELIAYVQANADFAALYGEDAELLEACTSDQALAEQLTIRFVGRDELMFTLSGFPHVIGVCNGDLFSKPIAELKQFLAPTAKDYFPSLAD